MLRREDWATDGALGIISPEVAVKPLRFGVRQESGVESCKTALGRKENQERVKSQKPKGQCFKEGVLGNVKCCL